MSGVLHFVFLGLGLGAMYALGSLGLIVVYRGSGVLNFAQGAIGMVGAYMVFELVGRGAPWAVSAGLGLVGSAVIGLLVHVLLMNQLRTASPLTRIVATLGVLITLQAIANIRYGPSPIVVPSGIESRVVELLGTRATTDRLSLVVIAAVCTLGLWAVYRYTAFGRATTAVADNQRSAATLGTSPNKVAAINWALGSGLGGLSAILAAPLLTLSPQTMTSLLLASLAVALLASFRSFPLALVGGLFVGVVQVLVGRYVEQVGLSQAVPFIFIIVVMTVGGRSLPLRDYMFQRLPTVGSGRVRPLLVIASAGGMAALIPVLGTVWQDAFIALFSMAVIMLSVVLLTGYGGQLSLGQFALAGMGAFVAGRLMATAGWSFLPAVAIGIVVCIPLGLIFALPAVRSRGINLAIVTLGLGSALEYVVFNNEQWTGGWFGTTVPTPELFGWSIDPIVHPERYAWVAIAAFVLVGIVVANIRRRPSGRRLLAIRTNERAAATLGIDVVAGKLFAFAVSAGIAGLGGALFAFRFPNVSYIQFTTFLSILIVCYTVLGGVGWIAGALFGATFAPGSIGGPAGNALLPGLGEYIDLIGGIFIIVIVLTHQSGMAEANLHFVKLVAKPLRRVASLVPGFAFRTERRATDGTSDRLPTVTEAHTVPRRTLEVRDLTVRYGAVTAVDHVTFDVLPGKVLGLIGPNGAGKTSVIDAVAGLTSAENGTVVLDGEDISALRVHERAHRGLSRSFQSLELFEDSTVLENIQTASDSPQLTAYFRDPVLPDKSKITDAAVAAIHEFGLDEHLETPAEDLSYGQRRLLAIARAVATGPSVLLLDEPAAGLGDAETAELATLVRRLADEWGMAILVVEHDMSFVMSLCDELLVMDFGKQIATGNPAAVQKDPVVLAAYLGEEEDEEAPIVVVSNEPDRQPEGRIVRSRSSAKVFAAEEVLLECHGLAAGYHGEPVVMGIDLSVRSGEVVALLGANGAGKSTVISALAGELSAMEGKVVLLGEETNAPMHRRARQGLGVVLEERSTFRSMTLRDNLQVGDADPEIALELFPELTKRLDVRGGLLSGGEQQMLALGRAVSRQPRVLLADEVSLGLAPMVATRLLAAIRTAADEFGMGVVLVEQHVRKALRFSNSVYVMRRGQIEVSGPAAELEQRVDEIQASYMSKASTTELATAPRTSHS